jgi:hypothetical protein
MPALSTIAALAPSALGLGSMLFGGGKGKEVEYKQLQSPEQQQLMQYIMQMAMKPMQPNQLQLGAANMASRQYLGQPYQHQQQLGGQMGGGMGMMPGMMPQFQIGGQGGQIPGGNMPRRSIRPTGGSRGRRAIPA